jgi:hypothetical protein
MVHMNVRARRRVAAVVASSMLALVAVVAQAHPASASGLALTPNTAFNSGSTTITFTTDASHHYEYGGTATFTYIPTTSDTSTTSIPVSFGRCGAAGTPCPQNSAPQISINFAGWDAGDYDVSIHGNGDPGSTGQPVTGMGAYGATPPYDDSCSSCFTVASAGPVSVNNASPNHGGQGGSVTTNIFGNNFERSAIVELLLNGVVDPKMSFAKSSVPTRTMLSGTVAIAADAARGVRDIRVANRNGNTALCAACFIVDQAPITGSSPNGAGNEGPGLTTVTFTGTELPAGTPWLNFVSGNPGSSNAQDLSIPGQNARNASATSMTADFDLRDAAPGQNAYQPAIIATDGSVARCTCFFSVLQRPDRVPYVGGLDSRPDLAGDQQSQPRGTTRIFGVHGQNFSRGVIFKLNLADLNVLSSRYISPTQGEVTIFAPANAALGNRDVKAQLTDNTISAWCTGCHFVSQAELDPAASPKPCPTVIPSPSTSPATTASPSPSPTSSPFPSPSPTPCISASPSKSASPSASASASPPNQNATSTQPQSRYVGLSTPRRAFDSRGTSEKLRRGEVDVSLADYIPGPATAAVLNVTIAGATGPGHVVVYPAGETPPATSNVNFVKGQAQANEVITRVSDQRDVAIAVNSNPSAPARAAVIVDVVGYFTADLSSGTGRISLSSPKRIFDSATTGQTRRRGETKVTVPSVPTGTTAVVLNVAVDGPDQPGYVTVYPTGSTRPNTSNVNFMAGQTQANEVVTDLGTGRQITLFLGGGRILPGARLIVDLVGTIGGATAGSASPTARASTALPTATASPRGVVSSSGATALTPLDNAVRVMDTRPGSGNVGVSSGRKNGQVTLTLPDTLSPTATAVVLNVTTTGADRPGYVAVYPGSASNPGTSNVAFRPGREQANEVLVAIGPNRTVTLFVGGGGGPLTHLIVDLTGYLAPVSVTGTSGPSPTGTARPSPTRTSSGSSPSPSPTLSPTPTPSPTPSPTPASPTPSPTCSPGPAPACVPAVP